MKIIKKFIVIIGIISISFLSCGGEKEDDGLFNLFLLYLLFGNSSKYASCYTTGQYYNSESWSKVPSNVSRRAFSNNTSLPIKSTSTRGIPSEYYIDSKYLPPVGNQGQYGTCVAWSVGYGAMSIMEAVKTGNSPSTSDKQFSPKHLFWNIQDSKKGENCGGTYPEDAWSYIQKSGIAPLKDVPYEDLGSCSYSSSFENQYKTVASNYKIENFRKIEVKNSSKAEEDIKDSIANNIPVVIAARLGDNFSTYTYSKNNPYKNDTYYNDDYCEHSLHAMLVVGYNDNAYKILNSWGPTWGDNGYVWVDKTFFHTNPEDSSGNITKVGFMYGAAVAKSTPSKVIVDSTKDLIATSADISCSGSNCEWYWITQNKGETSVKVSDGSSPTWYIALVAYNAYNAEEIKLLAYEAFSKNGTDTTGTDSNGIKYGYWKVDFNKGTYMYRDNTNPIYFTLPTTLNGSYYLALLVDAEDVIEENKEDNNYVWTTSDPISFSNGTASSYGSYQLSVRNSSSPGEKTGIDFETLKRNDSNTYTPDEISQAFNNHREKEGTSTRSVLAEPKGTTTPEVSSPPKIK
ncbi:MAG: C1 family peptidase [Leptospiraceae bacterium]|nr:C1 family peptidase [Leptospiraceae bacterium]